MKYEEAKELYEKNELLNNIEYRDFINKEVYINLTNEVDKLFECGYYDYSEAKNPKMIVEYNDLRDEIIDFFGDLESEEEIQKYLDEANISIDLKTIDENTTINKVLSEYLDYESDEEIINIADNLEIEYTELEPYEWYVVSDYMVKKLEDMGEIVIDNFWGRCTTGQAIYLDKVLQKIYINYLKNKWW